MPIGQILFALGIVALATGAIIDLLRNGSIFADLRAYFEARIDAAEADESDEPADDPDEFSEESPAWMAFLDAVCPVWFARLFLCSRCLGGQLPLWLLLVFFAPWGVIHTFWTPGVYWTLGEYAWKLPVCWLACVRAAQLLNGWMPPKHRYDPETPPGT